MSTHHTTPVLDVAIPVHNEQADPERCVRPLHKHRRVDIVATAIADLTGIVRVVRALASGRLPIGGLRRQLGRYPLDPPPIGVPVGLARQLVRFAGIGVASTAAYLVIFLLLRLAVDPQAASLAAMLITAVGNTAANRRITFGVTGNAGALRSQLPGLVMLGVGLALTAGGLAFLHGVVDAPGRPVEVAVLVTANMAAALLRFLLLRVWVFRQSGEGVEPAGTNCPNTDVEV